MNNSLKDRLVRHMEDGHYEPQSKSELARALNVDSRQKQDFRAIVDQLEEEGRLVRLQKGRYALKRERRNLVHGMIRILRSGKILFLPKRGIPPRRTWGGIWRPFRSWSSSPTTWEPPWTGTAWPCAWNARRPRAGETSAGTAFLLRIPA
ncbi:hypothetical protein ABFY27_12080 [Akkermansia massiliensis]